jgi:thioredoxin
MSVKELNKENIDEFISSGNVIVDFSAPWCGPCKIMEPEFEKASETFKEIKFGKVDVDGNQDLAGRFQVMSVPTTIFFKEKEQVDRHSGALSARNIEEKVKKSFG